MEADFHVQRVGTLEVDAENGVSDDEIVDQEEGVFVDGMGLVSLWHKNKTTCMFMWMRVYKCIWDSGLCDSRVDAVSQADTLPSDLKEAMGLLPLWH